MADSMDYNNIRKIIAMTVERWAGESFDDNQRAVLDEFMEEEIKPLSQSELLRRMGTSGEVLKWFVRFLRNRIPDRFCEFLPASADEVICYPS